MGLLLLAFCTFVVAGDLRAQEKGSLLVMPLPAHVVLGEGEFLIDGHFGISLKGYKEPRLEQAQHRFLERLSQETGIPLTRIDVTIEGVRMAAEPTRFARMTMTFELAGVSATQAAELVETYRGR